MSVEITDSVPVHYPERLETAIDHDIINGVDSSLFLDDTDPNAEEIHAHYWWGERVITISQMHYPALATAEQECTIIHELGHAIDQYTDYQLQARLPSITYRSGVRDSSSDYHKQASEQAANVYTASMHPAPSVDEELVALTREVLEENSIPEQLIP